VTVLDWLLDSDPAIRWQVMRDLTHEPADVVAGERSRVATEGWGARLLALQGPDGLWSGGSLFPEWTSTTHTLLVLRYMGLDPKSAQARRAVALVRDNAKWEHAGQAYFSGEVEPCINGKAVAIGSYFYQDVSGIVDRLLGEQMSDGGWNCEAENGSTRGSFHTTIDVLDGLLDLRPELAGHAELARQVARTRQRLGRPRVHPLTALGQPQAAPVPIQQLSPKAVLQPAQVAIHNRRCDAQVLSGAINPAKLHDQAEDLELLQRDAVVDPRHRTKR